MTTVRIELFSDFICPWCYLGDVRLGRVKQSLAHEIDLEIQVLPYLLYPKMPEGGVAKSTFAKRTKPGMGKALRSEAELEGIQFNYKHIERIPSSRKAHRMTCLIEDYGTKYKFSKEILKAYFEEGENIEDTEFLVQKAEMAGAERETINFFEKNENAGQDIFERSLIEAKNHFVSIVPTIRLDGKFMVPGLQAVDVYEKYIRRAAEIQNKG